MTDRFVRTEAGRREIRERTASLSRPARNLLLIIDASKTGAEWLALVQGCTAADLQQLLDDGLVAVAGGPAAITTPGEPLRPPRTLEQALQALGYRELYELLTHQARPRLGLIKGYKMVLEVERCNGPDEIRALALRFAALVREVQGEAQAQALRRQLGGGRLIPRLFVDGPLVAGQALALPPNAARHVQVLRLQPGAALTLFDGRGGQWQGEVLAIGRKDVQAIALGHDAVEREAQRVVTLAPGMPANERMDSLIEKATELGAAAIRPLVCERSVLRLAGERAERKAVHWRAITAAACEQCGRNRLPEVAAPQPLRDALAARPPDASAWALSLAADARPVAERLSALAAAAPVWVFSGPEGGFSPAEEAALRANDVQPVSLGPRVLRADTAPLAILALLELCQGRPAAAQQGRA